jgi:hypothetical protein
LEDEGKMRNEKEGISSPETMGQGIPSGSADLMSASLETV